MVVNKDFPENSKDGRLKIQPGKDARCETKPYQTKTQRKEFK